MPLRERPRGVILVRQREAKDCGVACVAMVTGRPYEDVRALFPTPMDGTCYMGVNDALWDLGFASHVLYRWRQSDRRARAWPPFEEAPLPWIVQVVGPAGGHYVVLDEQRRVLCPAAYFTHLVWPASPGMPPPPGEVQHVIAVIRRPQ